MPPPPPIAPPPPPPPPPLTITTGTKSLVAERLLLAQSPERVGSQYTNTAPLTLQGGQSKIRRIKMSEAEDIRAVVDNHDFQSIIEEESGRSSSVDYLDTYEDIPKEAAREYTGDTKEELFEEEKETETFVENETKPIETEKKEATRAAGPATVDDYCVARRDESATRIGTTTGTIIDGRNENAPVGEWNSLPLLVERLRAALEISLGGRRDDEPPPSLLDDSGVDSEEDLRIRSSMEQTLANGKESELKRDLKFLEDLLLSDIQTALSRLRETLERIDVAALARHGAASDPTSKLQLLRLVSSLLSRLQVPEEVVAEEIPALPSTAANRRRRATRHTIGVSAEELAKARKWLEEERSNLPAVEVATIAKRQKEQNVSANGQNVIVDRKPEEIRDKCIKDAINQRQLLEDKNKEIRDSCALRGSQRVDVGDDKGGEESSMCQAQCRSNNYQDKVNNENGIGESEERSRVSKLAAAIRQRAELSSADGGRFAGGNKFSAKKSKIKRANTIDIPSYLKLQSGSPESTGCVSLRKPIGVGDRAFNSVNVNVPSFQPRTENDRKFLALISKNNEAPTVAPVVPFKTFGHVKTMDASTNEHWNSRFSNIKTTFDKPSSAVDERENKSSLKARANKMFPSAAQAPVYSDPNSNYVPQVAKMDAPTGFRHAPSSPFRKIEKSSPVAPTKVPPSYHWPKTAPAPSSTLKEKARKMFDRENAQPSSKSSRADLEKPSFPRPPWIEHERNENRTNDTVTENGKLDYRSFCKQFAPFVGKSTSMESKQVEENRRRESGHRDRVSGVVDGKISFKMIPDKRVQTHQYPPIERRASKERLETAKSGTDRGQSGNNFADAILRGSSSVAVQTGIGDEHQDEGRSFRVAPRISRDQNLVCSNAAVQTSGELVGPVKLASDTEDSKQWGRTCCEQPDSGDATLDRQRFVLDHNQNYRTASSGGTAGSDARRDSGERGIRGSVHDSQGAQCYQKQAGNPATCYRAKDSRNDDYSTSFVSSPLPNYNQSTSDEVASISENKLAGWPIEGSSFTDDQNIQNQDISPEVGVVTRYTCAIATVATSVDSPEPRSEEAAIDSRTSSTPSPSQRSWSRSRPPTNEAMTSDDEIRRHNLLQQSLVRRLQNEITSLNDEPEHYQASNYGHHLTVDQSQPKSTSQSPNLIQSHQPQSYNQSPNVTQTHQQQSYNQSPNVTQSHQQQSYNQSPNVTQTHQQQSYNQSPNTTQTYEQQSYGQAATVVQSNQQQSFHQSITPVHQQPYYNQPANFDQPSNLQGPNRFGKFLTPIPQKKPDPPRTHSPVPVPANRVGTLRDAYEQSPIAHSKPIEKERSPVSNAVPQIDSSDEYLVSCATKPCRSIVLSKSESWHQLALSNSYPRAPKVNVPASTSAFSRNSPHPKPPKPRSPSSQKLRSKQYEASSMADSVKKMEDKIRQYFDHPADCVESKDSARHRRSPRFASKGMVGLSRSRTMPGLADERLHVLIPAPQQVPLLNVNTADVDKVFDDLFEEATRIDKQ